MDNNIWQDIDDAIDVALDERLYLQSQSALVARSDALLASLPQMRNRRTTTAELLRRYHVELQQELCRVTARECDSARWRTNCAN